MAHAALPPPPPLAQAGGIPAARPPGRGGAAADGWLLDGYRPRPGVWDELTGGEGSPWPGAARVATAVGEGGAGAVAERQRRAAEGAREMTFAAKTAWGGLVQRAIPFDVLPRPLPAAEWARAERGLAQRVRALNLFLDDVYGRQRIVAAGEVPEEVVRRSAGYRPALVGIRAPGGVRAHVAGIDLVRGVDGELVVLEDNLRVPSGVSYVLALREVMEAVHPGVADRLGVRRVDGYPARLRAALAACAPAGVDAPRAAVLTLDARRCPAWFEDVRLGRWLQAPLAQPHALSLEGDRLHRRTAAGSEPIDLLYLRLDEPAIPPGVRRMLVRAWAAGTLTLANAPGNGVADDKAVFAFVPRMIRFYLGEEPVLHQVRTWLCARPDERAYVLANLDRLVLKRADLGGGRGIVIGPRADGARLGETAAAIRAHPARWVAQPLVELSTAPVWTGAGVEPRRVDLRPYVLSGGPEPWVLPGGLTRVTAHADQYLVNNSQGGGAKDTWVLEGGDADGPRGAG